MITITKATFKDLPEVANLVLNEFVKETHSHIKELETADNTSHNKFLEDYIWRAENSLPSIVYVAKEGNKIIGAAGGSVSEHHWSSIKWGSEDFWFVKKEHRKGKTGLKLFNKLMNWFESNGADRISMTHYSWNPKVRKFYERKGFKPFEVNYVKEVSSGS